MRAGRPDRKKEGSPCPSILWNYVLLFKECLAV